MPVPIILSPVPGTGTPRHAQKTLLCGHTVPQAGPVPAPHPTVPAVPVPAMPPCLRFLSRGTPGPAQGPPRSITAQCIVDFKTIPMLLTFMQLYSIPNTVSYIIASLIFTGTVTVHKI